MKGKSGKLIFSLLILVSLQGFSQTPKESSHPLLDKYYPRPQVDTPTVVIQSPPVPETPVPQKIVPQKNTTTPSAKPSVAETKITPEAKPVPVVNDSSVITQRVEPVVSMPNTPAVSTSVAPVASASVQPAVPATKPAASKPSTPYNRERLGSSSPLYNTWEKNNNGAGSVTTGSK
ncbi:MAG TPA: hypothetical protein VN722_13190 [Hanamia sp.]|nr:hypothetical protein [Hanamia sp.]